MYSSVIFTLSNITISLVKYIKSKKNIKKDFINLLSDIKNININSK